MMPPKKFSRDLNARMACKSECKACDMYDREDQQSALTRSEIQVHAADGRALRGMSFGPVTGQPVLFIAGAATGCSMYFGLSAVIRLGRGTQCRFSTYET